MIRSKVSLQPRWLPSGKAAEFLGISKTSLRRYAAMGVLAEGTHYLRGLTERSPWRWEVTAVSERIMELTTLPVRSADGG